MKHYIYEFKTWPAGDAGLDDPNAMEALNKLGAEGWLLVGKIATKDVDKFNHWRGLFVKEVSDE